MSEFRYLRASEWGIRWARPPLGERLGDPECFVHHSAGNHVNDAVQAFRNLNEYAINTKKYSALDYDVLVHRNKLTGVVTIGGGREGYMSAATADRNEQGEAVCVLGYFHPGHQLSRQPHPDEIEGTALGIVWGIEHGWIARDAVIMGHRDNPAHPGATGCPGDFLYAHMPTIRRRVAELLAPPIPVPEPPVPTPTPPEDEMTEFVKVAVDPARPADPGTLFAVQGLVAWHVSPAQFAAAGVTPSGRTLTRAECSKYAFVGNCPNGYHGIWAQDGHY